LRERRVGLGPDQGRGGFPARGFHSLFHGRIQRFDVPAHLDRHVEADEDHARITLQFIDAAFCSAHPLDVLVNAVQVDHRGGPLAHTDGRLERFGQFPHPVFDQKSRELREGRRKVVDLLTKLRRLQFQISDQRPSRSECRLERL
jgi:hypothetical protein